MSNENPSWGYTSPPTIWERAEEAHYVHPSASEDDGTIETQSTVSPEQTSDTLGPTSVLAETVTLDLPEDNVEPRKIVGFATDPGYDDRYDAYGSRKVDDNPRHF